mmetsp:Transcript_38706/g.64204  ORF Transcript_38706/g.64204 Transcript_38706/m.64204 type:complete len:670 (-) Transcript_38706:447-2456(-)
MGSTLPTGERSVDEGASSASEHAIAFMTDVEGNWDYFLAYINLSEAFDLIKVDDDGTADIVLRDGWAFVFGGDVVDKGGFVGGSIRTVRSLVRLKRKYPERVTLILGNRDLNKIRLTSELDSSQLALSRLAAMPGPYWVPETKRVTPEMYLRKVAAAEHSIPESKVSESQLATANTLANRIRWMLKETMGADGEFERRQEELVWLNGGSPVSEEQTAQNFVDSVQQGGFMRDFLLLGQLAVIVRNTLFVHGGVVKNSFCDGSTDAVGYIPGRAERVAHVVEWVDELNEWCRNQVQEWTDHPQWHSPDSSAIKEARGGWAIIDYVVPGCCPSVVMSRHLNENGMPLAMDKSLMERLNRGGIRRLVLGHTPHGNCPTVIKSSGPGGMDPSVEVIMADTSYSDMQQLDNRGNAVSEVQVLPDNTLRVHGRLEDNERILYTLQPTTSQSELIGLTHTVSNRFVKAYLPEKRSFLFCNVNGFKTEYDVVDTQAAYKLFELPMPTPDDLPILKHKSKSQSSFTSSGDDGMHGCDHEIASHRAAMARDLFHEIDKNGSNNLSLNEIKEALNNNQVFWKLVSGMSGTHALLSPAELLKRMDADGDYRVSLTEFQDVCKDIWRHTRPSTTLEMEEIRVAMQPRKSAVVVMCQMFFQQIGQLGNWMLAVVRLMRQQQRA